MRRRLFSHIGRIIRIGVLSTMLVAAGSRAALAQTTLALPDTSQTTTLTASASDQARRCT